MKSCFLTTWLKYAGFRALLIFHRFDPHERRSCFYRKMITLSEVARSVAASPFFHFHENLVMKNSTTNPSLLLIQEEQLSVDSEG